MSESLADNDLYWMKKNESEGSYHKLWFLLIDHNGFLFIFRFKVFLRINVALTDMFYITIIV
jgi:hypothetical protein